MPMTSFSFKPYVAIIGDLIDSRRLQDRKTVQEKLSNVLNDTNKIYSSDLCSKFMITLGDEFQGLMQKGNHVIDILEKIERDIYPIRVRFGIGVGEITTEIDSSSPFGADGSAYYNARYMIDALKTVKKKKMKPMLNIGIKIENHDSMTALINSIFSQNAIIKSKWTTRQREIVYAYVKCGGTQDAAGKMLGINQSTVQKALQASGYYTSQYALRSVTDVLVQIMENYCV